MSLNIIAQPLLPSKQVVNNSIIYQDLKKTDTYYYAPGNLELALQPDGKPKFKLIQYRYTGTARSSDQGEKRFLNIVQFTVQLDQVKGTDLRKIKTHLGTGKKLYPLPIRNVAAWVIAPVEDKYEQLGSISNAQSVDGLGQSTRSSYWKERTFTIRLENHEAELLWKQIEDGQLSISVSYAFYADMITGLATDFEMEGDSALVESFETALEDLKQLDSTATTQTIKANTFSIKIDVNKYPGLLQKIDGNENSIPIGFPALEVACFDFVDGIRPDLGEKLLSIKAVGINNTIVTIDEIGFSKYQPDLNIKQIKFNRPVRIDQPLRYQITEVSKDGEMTPLGWKDKSDWLGILDISTAPADNPFEKKEIEIETAFEEEGIKEVVVQLFFKYKRENRVAEVLLKSSDAIPLKQFSLLYDKGTIPKYLVISNNRKNGRRYSRFLPKPIPRDDYIFIETK